jgi:hypothetical protein
MKIIFLRPVTSSELSNSEILNEGGPLNSNFKIILKRSNKESHNFQKKIINLSLRFLFIVLIFWSFVLYLIGAKRQPVQYIAKYDPPDLPVQSKFFKFHCFCCLAKISAAPLRNVSNCIKLGLGISIFF